jgi:hypothetical protein
MNTYLPSRQNIIMRSFLFCLLLPFSVCAQHNYRVLFLGNSYTASNSLPNIISQMATASGDNLQTDENLPGGYTFEAHSTDVVTLQKISQGNWDYVVLQEQSQRPSFPESQVQSGVYPYARKLDSLIKASNPCAQTVFFMTWGRKNGDAMNCQFFPPLCTYEGMDSLLALRYRIMADDNKALLSPVGALWNAIRKDKPGLNLYDADESHPSPSGSYAAACAFYTVLLGKNPDAVNYDYSLPDTTAAYIRNMAKQVVFDSLKKWNYFINYPKAGGFFVQNDRHLQFNDTSYNADDVLWIFNDSTSSSDRNPGHQFPETLSGKVRVMLIASKCMRSDTAYFDFEFDSVTKAISDVSTKSTTIFPNPVQAGQVVAFSQTIQWQLVDIQTKEVARGFGDQMPTQGLKPGIYFLRNEGQQSLQKIIITP